MVVENSKIDYWIYSPGEGAKFWEEFYNLGIMGIGWDKIGDLSKIKSKEEMAKKIQNYYGDKTSRSNDALACYDFVYSLKPKDIIIPKKGTDIYLGYGVVQSDYIPDTARKEFKNIRKVKWMKKGEWPGTNIVQKVLTQVTKDTDVNQLITLIGIDDGVLSANHLTELDTPQMRKLVAEYEKMISTQPPYDKQLESDYESAEGYKWVVVGKYSNRKKIMDLQTLNEMHAEDYQSIKNLAGRWSAIEPFMSLIDTHGDKAVKALNDLISEEDSVVNRLENFITCSKPKMGVRAAAIYLAFFHPGKYCFCVITHFKLIYAYAKIPERNVNFEIFKQIPPKNYPIYLQHLRELAKFVASISPSSATFWEQQKEKNKVVDPDNLIGAHDFVFNLSTRFLDSNQKEKSEDGGETMNENANVQKTTGTQNIILYGPPGTGKTYSVAKIASQIIESQKKEISLDELKILLKNNDNLTLKQLRERLNQSAKKKIDYENLTWENTILYSFGEMDKEKAKVTDMMETKTIKEKARANERIAGVPNTLWSILQAAAPIDSKTVKYKKKNGKELFDKDEQSAWYLTPKGKSQLQELKKEIAEVQLNQLEFVTFHQNYSYEDFVEGYRPITNEEDKIIYEVRPGIFKRICKNARDDPGNNYVLIIDEINRANISKVFGELITLIEDNKRLGCDEEITVTLPYSPESFGVPKNLYIIGTMNSTDKSIALVDIALRRRFAFIRMDTQLGLISYPKAKTFLENLNTKIRALKDQDHEIGHSDLMRVENEQQLKEAFVYKILPLLEEYFPNDWGALATLLGKDAIDGIGKNIKNLNLEDGKLENGGGISPIRLAEPEKVFESAIKNLTQNESESQSE